MNEHNPDKWMVVKVSKQEGGYFYKILGSWWGGYMGANSWRFNSGVVKVEKEGGFYKFYGNSGSVYKCHKESYGGHSLARSVISEKDYFEELEDRKDWTKYDFKEV